MGYNTRYKIAYKDLATLGSISRETKEKIQKYYESFDDEYYGITDCDICSWYDHDTSMLKVSKEFPEVVFILSGEGEESGDLWKKYYSNGIVEIDAAKIAYTGMTSAFLENARKNQPRKEKAVLMLTSIELERLISEGIISKEAVLAWG